MLGIHKGNFDELLHLLLGVFTQGEELYNQQRDEIREFYGDEDFFKAEKMLKETRLYELLSEVS